MGEVVGAHEQPEDEDVDGPGQHAPLQVVSVGSASPPAVNHRQPDQTEDRP